MWWCWRDKDQLGRASPASLPRNMLSFQWKITGSPWFSHLCHLHTNKGSMEWPEVTATSSGTWSQKIISTAQQDREHLLVELFFPPNLSASHFYLDLWFNPERTTATKLPGIWLHVVTGQQRSEQSTNTHVARAGNRVSHWHLEIMLQYPLGRLELLSQRI